MRPAPDNDDVADVLERVGDLLEAQRANAYRVRAYRTAARNLRAGGPPTAEVLEREGVRGLERLPGIGPHIAALISEYAHTGRVTLLERLEGQVSPEDLFTTVPGIGEGLAQRIHESLGVETLEDLEVAAHDGRLESVRGIGRRRIAALRAALAEILGRAGRRRARRLRWIEGRDRPGAEPAFGARPAVDTLLWADAEYRRRAALGELPRITPRRFNPEGRAWLPILHCERDGWSLTALYSNTARAHELGRTRDWVVIYSERDGDEAQATVVTERAGPLAGRRVVRGRESEGAAPAGRPVSATPPPGGFE